MPAFCTHYLFGEEFLLELPTEKRHNKNFRSAFFYGVHGPDFLLFHRAMPMMFGKNFRKLGETLHADTPVPLLEKLQQMLIEHRDNDFIQGYVAGFICHYALDRTAHPYVNFLQEAIIRKEKIRYSPTTVHIRIETNIDRFMLMDRLKINDARKFSASETLSTDEKLLKCISSMMSKVINSLYKTKITTQSIMQSFADFRKIQTIISNENYWRTPFFKMAELPLIFTRGPIRSALLRSGRMRTDWDYANTTGRKWMNLHTKSKTSQDTFIEIYENALSQAVYMYDEILAGGNVMEITGNVSFDKGVPMKQTGGN